MDLEGLAKAVATVLGSVGAVAAPMLHVFNRDKRLREKIRENLSLAEELEKHAVLRQNADALVWIYSRVTLDVAKLSGQPVGNPKKPLPKGAMVFNSLVAIGAGWWVYGLNENGFNWYSLLPGSVAFLMLFSVFGMTLNREIPTPASTEASGEAGGAVEEAAG